MFSQTAEYALRAMSWLALTPDDLVPTPLLAERTKVPSNYLSKVLQQLAGAGLIVGRRGVGGGYKLARAAADVTLIQVVNAVDKVERIASCPLGLSEHGTNLCPLHRISDKAAEAVIEILGGTTLQDLVDDKNASKPLCDAETIAKLTVSGRRG
jgi:Rrf2 family transcriptional regulator, nitric oxide-sensitive transcriptional repressor